MSGSLINTPLWAHQKYAIEKAKGKKYFALFLSPGIGKTRTLINIYRDLCNQRKNIYSMLIICPPIVISNWRDEFLKFSKMRSEWIVCLMGSGKERLKQFNKAIEENPDKIVVTNYESMLMPELYAAIEKWAPRCITLDEGHRIANKKAKRTKAILRLSQTSTFKYILTGTPILNSPMDLFTQFLFLDGGQTFGTNFFAFRHRYFYDKNAAMPKVRYFPKFEIKPGSIKEISDKIEPHSIYAKIEDCLDLPPLIEQTLKVGMSASQAKAYKEMKQEFLTVVKDKLIMANLAMTKALKLMQIASGFVNDMQGESHSLGVTPKQEALKELLEELCSTEKVIVWAAWKNNYTQIREVCDSLNLKYVELTGESATKERQAFVDAFREDPEIRVCIANPGASGEGVNLQVARTAIFYSLDFSLGKLIQSQARNYRGGSEVHATVKRIYIQTENTIDTIIMKKLLAKEQISEDTLIGLINELEEQEK